MCLSVRECVCVCLCDFLRELLHFGHCKLLYCFGSIFFFFAFFFLSSFYFLLFFCFLLSAFVSICDFILFWYFFPLVYFLFFSFPSFFNSIVSLRDEIAGEGDFFHSSKGVQKSVCPLGKRIKNKKKQVRLLVTRIWAFFQPFCVSFKETVIGACLLALLCFALL